MVGGYGLLCVLQNRVQWTKEEDQLLQRLASQPPTNWRLVTESLNNTVTSLYIVGSVVFTKHVLAFTVNYM